MPYFGTDLKQFGYAATEKDTFSGDDSTVAFTLSQTSATNDVEVFVGNVQQEPTVAYSISGSTLTFTEAPPTGTNNIYVLHRGRTRDTILPPADLGDKNYLMSGGFTLLSVFDITLSFEKQFKQIVFISTTLTCF